MFIDMIDEAGEISEITVDAHKNNSRLGEQTPEEVWKKLHKNVQLVASAMGVYGDTYTTQKAIEDALRAHHENHAEVDIATINVPDALKMLSEFDIVASATPEEIAKNFVDKEKYGELATGKTGGRYIKGGPQFSEIKTVEVEQAFNRNAAAQAQLQDNPKLGGEIMYKLKGKFRDFIPAQKV
jgi:hypothetical protein